MRTLGAVLALPLEEWGGCPPHSLANLGFSFWACLCPGAFLFCLLPLGAPAIVRLRVAFLVLGRPEVSEHGSGEKHEALSGEL